MATFDVRLKTMVARHVEKEPQNVGSIPWHVRGAPRRDAIVKEMRYVVFGLAWIKSLQSESTILERDVIHGRASWEIYDGPGAQSGEVYMVAEVAEFTRRRSLE